MTISSLQMWKQRHSRQVTCPRSYEERGRAEIRTQAVWKQSVLLSLALYPSRVVDEYR